MLAKRLIKLRNEKKKTQQQIADILGITRPAYTAYERGSRQPDYDTLQKIAEIHTVTTDYLLGRTDNPQSSDTKNNDDYDSLEELSKLIKEFGIDDSGFFDIDQWKNLSPEDIEEVRRHFEWISHKAKERKNAQK
nr:helix-turn-helix transcriptional regulator [Pseudalkalibacillus sedimenti]